MNRFKLTPKTRKGKQRIQRDGEWWTELAQVDSVLFSTEKGPWLHLESEQTKDDRWVHFRNDPDFNVIEDF